MVSVSLSSGLVGLWRGWPRVERLSMNTAALCSSEANRSDYRPLATEDSFPQCQYIPRGSKHRLPLLARQDVVALVSVSVLSDEASSTNVQQDSGARALNRPRLSSRSGIHHSGCSCAATLRLFRVRRQPHGPWIHPPASPRPPRSAGQTADWTWFALGAQPMQDMSGAHDQSETDHVRQYKHLQGSGIRAGWQRGPRQDHN